MKEYMNKESKEIEKFINDARDRLIKEGMPPECMPYKAKVIFVKDE